MDEAEGFLDEEDIHRDHVDHIAVWKKNTEKTN